MKRILYTYFMSLSLATTSALIAMEDFKQENFNNSLSKYIEIPRGYNYLQMCPKVILWKISNYLELKDKARLRQTNKKFYIVFARPFVIGAIRKNFYLWSKDPENISNIIPSLNLAYEKEVSEILTGYVLLYQSALSAFLEKDKRIKNLKTHKKKCFESCFGTTHLFNFISNSFNWVISSVIARDVESYEKGINFLINKNLPKDIQKTLNHAAAWKQLNFTIKTGKKYLEQRSEKGDKHAQKQLNKAAYRGCLGFNEESGRQYLEDHAKKGDKHAQKQLNKAAYRGCLGFNEESGRQYLEDHAKKGDKHAQKQLNKAAYEGKFRFNEESGRQYLEDQAKKGNKDVQGKFNQAAYKGKLGFNEESGRQYLEDQAKKGDDHAQKQLNYAAYEGKFGFNEESGRQYLEDQAKKGDDHAQKRLNQSAFTCSFGFNQESGRKYLEQRSENGDEHAQSYLYYAASRLELGFSFETAYTYIKDHFLNGDKNPPATDHPTKLLLFSFYRLAMHPNKN